MAGQWFSSGTLVSSTDVNWMPWYYWNIVESGIKHQITNGSHDLLEIFMHSNMCSGLGKLNEGYFQ